MNSTLQLLSLYYMKINKTSTKYLDFSNYKHTLSAKDILFTRTHSLSERKTESFASQQL